MIASGSPRRSNPAGIAALVRLAEHTTSLSAQALGPAVADRVGWCLLDLFGCFLGARSLGVNRGLYDIVEEVGGGGATLWGTRRQAPAAQAVLVTGTVAHHLELDGGWHGPPGVGAHPAVTVIPAAVAVAEQTGASGRDVVAAIAAGYDAIGVMATCCVRGSPDFGSILRHSSAASGRRRRSAGCSGWIPSA